MAWRIPELCPVESAIPEPWSLTVWSITLTDNIYCSIILVIYEDVYWPFFKKNPQDQYKKFKFCSGVKLIFLAVTCFFVLFLAEKASLLFFFPLFFFSSQTIFHFKNRLAQGLQLQFSDRTHAWYPQGPAFSDWNKGSSKEVWRPPCSA